MTRPTAWDHLITINDALTPLLNELGITFNSDEEEDTTLNDLTHLIAEHLGITTSNP